jgi:hypothetical protein
MLSPLRSTVLAWAAFTLFWPHLPPRAQELRIQVLSVDQARRPRLRLEGLSGTPAVLESSPDLRNWFSVGYETFAGAAVEFTHEHATNFGSLYYRGLSAFPPLRVDPRIDATWSMSTLVTTNGGMTELWTPDGFRYRLSVPPLAIAAPTVVTITRITNIVDYPFNQPMTAAVSLEPRGLVFTSPAQLEIIFPTNAVAADIASFAFDGDGGEFRLTPALFATNRVLIPILHFSGVGLGSLSQLQITAARARYVRNAFDRESQAIAIELLQERQRQLEGGKPNPALMRDLQSRARTFFDEYLKPLLLDTAGDCALFGSVMRRGLGLARQEQLLGIADESGPSIFSDLMAHFCAGLENCRNEVLNDCAEGRRSTGAISELLGMERQSQLLGMCDRESLSLDEILERCAPTLWKGRLSYVEKGATNQTTASSSLSAEERRSYQFEITGTVRAIEEITYPTGRILSLTFDAISTGHVIATGHSEWSEGCEGEGGTDSISDWRREVAGLGTNEINATFYFDSTGSEFTLPPDLILPSLSATATENYRFVPGSCPVWPADPVSHTAGSSKARFTPAYVDLSKESVSITTNRINITLSGSRVLEKVPTQWIFTLDLHR